jgi:hypothetical protein
MIEKPLLESAAQAKPVIRVRQLADLTVFAEVYTIADDENNECLPYGVTPTENEDRRSS